MGDHWKRRMCCAAAITWGCVGWYGWARLFHLICMNISCQEAELQSEISALYEKHMLQLSPLPGRFCSGSRNPRSLLWLALVSSQRSVTSGSDLNNWRISPSSITTCFVFTAGRWHYWRKDEYNSFSNTVCIHWCFFFLFLALLFLRLSLRSVGGMQNWKCQLLLLCSNPGCDGPIDTNNTSKSV